MDPIKAIIGDYNLFLDTVFSELEKLQIDTSAYFLDHVCYRVITTEQYESCNLELAKVGELLSTIILGGREIKTYKLNDPIVYKDRKIPLVELPQFKANSKNSYPLGLEHCEFAVGKDVDLHEFVLKYPHVKWDLSEMSKEINPAIRVIFSEGKGSVKFHHSPLEDVIRFEQQQDQK